MATRHYAVMFTDIKGFTSRTSGATREDFRSLLDEHDRLLRPVFRYFGGVVVKTIGDAFLVRFDSPTDAVVCGLALQSVLKQHNAGLDEERKIAVRVAINTGDVELYDGDILGEAVNVAARLEGIAEPGEVWFTEAVYLTMNRKEVPTTEIGERTFKGVPHPVRVFKVVSEPPNEQIRQIDQSVRLERGVPRLHGLRVQTDRGVNWRRWALAALVVVLLGPVVTLIGVQLWTERQAVNQVENLLTLGDTESALEQMDELLAERADDADVRDLGLRVARQHLDKLRARDEDPEVIRDWLEARLDDYGHLDALEDELVVLDAWVELNAAFDSGRRNQFWQTFRSLLERHPDSVDIPRIAAEIQRDNRQIVETRLWPYQVWVERAGFPDAGTELHEEMLSVVTTTLERNLPTTGYAQRAHELLQSMPEATRLAWAEDALEQGSGAALANSLTILAAQDDPRADEPVHRALRDLLARRNALNSMTILANDDDPQRGPRIAEILQDARLDLAADLNQAERARAEELQQTLSQRWL